LAEATDAKDDRAKRNVSLQAVLCVDDVLVAVGAISDMTFGLDAESGVSLLRSCTFCPVHDTTDATSCCQQPELVVIGGGAGPSVLNRLVVSLMSRLA
jgi:hypothetical protein